MQISGNCVSLPFCKGNKLLKTSLVIHCDVGKDFSVQFNASGFKSMDKPTVRQSVQSGGSVNSCDPKSPKIAFPGTPMCVGVVPSFLYCFFSGSLEVIPAPAIAFGMLKYPATAFTADTPCFYSCHLKLLLRPLMLSAIASTIHPDTCGDTGHSQFTDG